MLQQPYFVVEASAITHQVAVLADHAMAGNNNGHWVLPIGQSYRPNGIDVADPQGKVEIGYGFP